MPSARSPAWNPEATARHAEPATRGPDPHAVPTYEWRRLFEREFAAMSTHQQQAFLRAVSELVDDLAEGRAPRPGLRVKRVRGHEGVLEMTWAPNGRATFNYGEERRPGHPHIVWRRIGRHDIFRSP